jgi:hypothetical protein
LKKEEKGGRERQGKKKKRNVMHTSHWMRPLPLMRKKTRKGKNYRPIKNVAAPDEIYACADGWE